MSGTPYDDVRAGIRLVFPPGWDVIPAEGGELADDVDWMTTAAFPPSSSEKERRRDAENDAVDEDDDDEADEQEDSEAYLALWLEPSPEEIEQAAMRAPEPAPTSPPQPPPSTRTDGHGYRDGIAPGSDSDDDWLDLDELLSYLALHVGRWRTLPKEPPAEGELVKGAEWFANWILDSWEWFVPDEAQGLDRSLRPVRVSGHPAAAFRYHSIADESGATAAYMRLLLIQLPSGPPAFVLGAAQNDADRLLIDTCLDSVEALVPAPSHPRTWRRTQ